MSVAPPGLLHHTCLAYRPPTGLARVCGAPLVPVAMAVSWPRADRYGSFSIAMCGLGGIVSLVVGLVGRFRGAASTSVWLWLSAGCSPRCITTTIAIHLLTTISLRSRPRHQHRFACEATWMRSPFTLAHRSRTRSSPNSEPRRPRSL